MERHRLTLDQARALRLVNLGLAPTAPGAPQLSTVADVATHHLAMQAQEFGASQWAVASRLGHREVGRDDVLASFDAGEVVRTWPMRGTVHLLAEADARWLLDLCGPIALRRAAARWRTLEIDEAFIETVTRVARAALQDGAAISRDELVAAWEAAGLDFSVGQRRYHSVWYICQIGLAVQGPASDGDQLLVSPDTHVPGALRCSAEEALAMLGRRYLTARGPATVEDLQHWTKLTKTQCRQALAAVGEDLVEVEIEGHAQTELVALRSQVAAADQLAFGENVPRALVLPAFDEHLLGYRDRSLVLADDHARHVDPGRSGVFRHTVVLDGRVVGTWKRRILKTTAPVDVTLFGDVRASDRPVIEAAFEPWGHFIGLEPVVRFA